MDANIPLGAAYGTAKSGTGISAMAVMRPELIMKSVIPVVMAGIIAIYGLVVAVVITQNMSGDESYTLYKSFLHMGAGLSVGLSGLAAGFAIGIVGDAGARIINITAICLCLADRHAHRSYCHRATGAQEEPISGKLYRVDRRYDKNRNKEFAVDMYKK
nr:hypothetical protein BaRGS_016830 [Batillaria attramentaria]